MKKILSIVLSLCLLLSVALAETVAEPSVLIHLDSAYIVDADGNAVESNAYGFDFYDDLSTFVMTYGDQAYQGTYSITENGFALNDGSNTYEAIWNNDQGWYEMASGNYILLLVAEEYTVSEVSDMPIIRLDSTGVLDAQGSCTVTSVYTFFLYADGTFYAFYPDGSGEGTYVVLDDGIQLTEGDTTIVLTYDAQQEAYLMDTGDYWLVLVATAC